MLRYAVLLLGVWLLAACNDQEAQAGPQRAAAKRVRVAAAESRPVVYYDKYPGTVSPLEQVEVRPQVAGYVTRVHFKEGEAVRKNQLLYTIDNRTYRADVGGAEARVAAALAEKDNARYRRLAEQEAIALQTLDQSNATLTAARRQVDVARAALAGARTQLDYATVRAPLAGVTGIGSAKVGTQVSPGMPVLTTISQEAPVGVDFSLPQADIPRLVRLESRGGTGPDSTFRVQLPDGTLYGAYGSVYAIDRAVDPRTGTITVRLQFDNPDGVLRPGMNVEARVLNAQSGTQVLIPRQALNEQMGEFYVYQKRDSLALRRRVKPGKQVRADIIILDGIAAGDTIITEGLKALSDSSKVVVAPPATRREANAAE